MDCKNTDLCLQYCLKKFINAQLLLSIIKLNYNIDNSVPKTLADICRHRHCRNCGKWLHSYMDLMNKLRLKLINSLKNNLAILIKYWIKILYSFDSYFLYSLTGKYTYKSHQHRFLDKCHHLNMDLESKHLDLADEDFSN